MKKTTKTKERILEALENEETKEYLVSFEDWFVEAKNRERAEKLAVERLKDWGCPKISFIEENQNDKSNSRRKNKANTNKIVAR